MIHREKIFFAYNTPPTLRRYDEQFRRAIKIHKKKGVVAGIVNAGKPLPMLSVMDAVNEDLIIPIFIGDKDEIQKCADDVKFDISKFKVVHEPVENNTAKVAAKLASENKIKRSTSHI